MTAACVILIWGITFVNTRALLGEFSALEILVGRFALAWAALWGLEAWRRCGARSARPSSVSLTLDHAPAGGVGAARRRAWRDEGLFAAMGFCGIFCYQFLENCAIYYTSASNVAILVSFGPVVTAALARILCRCAQTTVCKFWVGSAMAIAGVALISFNNAVVFELRPLGDLMALGAMVSWGCYSILVGKANERGCPPWVAIRKAFGWALVMMLPFCVWGATEAGYCTLDGSFSVTLDGAANAERFSNPLTWLNLGFLGLLASAACFVMWNFACREIGVVRTTVGLYLTPIVGVVFAAVFLGERLTRMSLLGGGFIVIGVAIANWRWRR